MHNYNRQLLQFWVSIVFFCVLCLIKVKLSVKVKLFVPLLCVCAILPAKAVPEMTYTVSGRTLNPTHSLTHSIFLCYFIEELLGTVGHCALFCIIRHNLSGSPHKGLSPLASRRTHPYTP